MQPVPDSAGADSSLPEPDTAAQRLAVHLRDFAERAGHDLCGPLNQSSALTSLLVKRYRGRLDADADQMLDHLGSSAQRMEKLVAGLRQYLEAASPLPPREPADLNRVMAMCRATLRAPIESSSAAIACDPLPRLNTVPGRIQTLFESLIANAIQFAKPDTAPAIAIQVRQDGSTWRFSVSDEGMGIDPNDREVVFLPFRRLHGRTWPGPGLGLSTAQLIVESLDGAIHIEDGEKGGVAVVFTIPAAMPSGLAGSPGFGG